jgi:hypothetical protein
MRLRHFASGLFLALSVGCKDNPSDPLAQALAAAASAQAAAASAQAMGSAAVAESQARVIGNVHAGGGELGNWDVVLTGCQSGESKGFYGVDFFSAGTEEARLRYVHDEAMGDVVKVGVPGKADTMVVFGHDTKCSVLAGSIEKTNVTTWTPKGKIRHVNGHVKFDCKDGKEHVTGEATFSHCH